MDTPDLVVSSEPFVLSPKAAAERLSIDVSTLYRNYGTALRSGKIRSLKVGRQRRIVWQSLLAYIEAQTRHA